jgi:hypothetical protein
MIRRSRGALATLTFAPSHPSLKRLWSQQEVDCAAHHGVPLVGRRDAFESEPEVDGAERRTGGRHRDRGTPRPPVAARPAEHGSVAVGDPLPAAEGLHLDMAEGGAGGRADVALRFGPRRSPLGKTAVRTASTVVVVVRVCRGHAFVRPSGPCRALYTVAERVGEVWPSSAPPARPRRRLLNMPAYPTRTAAAMSARTSGVSAPG